MEVGLGPGHIVLDRDPAPPPRTARPPIFGPCSGQMAGWIHIAHLPLGMEVGLGPCNIVLDGDPGHPQKGGGAQPPIFGQCLLWQNGCMDQDGTWYEVGLDPSDTVRW